MRFFGVRGSTPAPGVEFASVGGNTSCVGVSRDSGPPTLVLDGGTGLRRLTRWLDGRPFDGAILLGHLHWDHVQGLPFFRAAEHPGSRTDVYLPAQGDPLAVLGGAMSPPHFPLRPAELRGRWTFQSLEAGEHVIEGFTLLALDIPHVGGRTFGFRIEYGGSTMAYLSDHSPLALGPGPEGWGVYHEAACRLAADVDLLVHDAQHVAEEFPAKAFLGHSVVEYAAVLATHAGARRVALFHHDPDRTDDEVECLLARVDGLPVEVLVAAEGLTVEV
ncbi:MAG: MBL fold metallo-hydrolase [Actinomycetota bacterium]|nr:MBL fold metallo-hydrolase [Actinomycetota bacterium]